MERAHCIVGLGCGLVVLLLEGLLQLRQMVGICLQVCIFVRHTNVVDKYGKLAYAELVHMGVFRHDVVDD